MKFDLYNIKSIDGRFERFDLTVNDIACVSIGVNSYTDIRQVLKFLCIHYSKYAGLNLKYGPSCNVHNYYNDSFTITHLLTIEYPDTETFFKNFIKDVKINSPELLL